MTTYPTPLQPTILDLAIHHPLPPVIIYILFNTLIHTKPHQHQSSSYFCYAAAGSGGNDNGTGKSDYAATMTTTTTTASVITTSAATATATVVIGTQTGASCLYGSPQPSPALDLFTLTAFAVMRAEAAAAADAGAVAKANARVTLRNGSAGVGVGGNKNTAATGGDDGGDGGRSVCMAFVRGLLDRLGLADDDGLSPSPSPRLGDGAADSHGERVRLVMLAGGAVEGLGLAQPALTDQIHSGLHTLLAHDLETTINNNHSNAHSPHDGPYAHYTLTHAISLALAQVALATLPTAACENNESESSSGDFVCLA